MHASDTVPLTRTEQRNSALGKIIEARVLIREAGKELSGLGETAERRATMVLVGIDDLSDAVVCAEQLDEEIRRMEEAAS